MFLGSLGPHSLCTGLLFSNIWFDSIFLLSVNIISGKWKEGNRKTALQSPLFFFKLQTFRWILSVLLFILMQLSAWMDVFLVCTINPNVLTSLGTFHKLWKFFPFLEPCVALYIFSGLLLSVYFFVEFLIWLVVFNGSVCLLQIIILHQEMGLTLF